MGDEDAEAPPRQPGQAEVAEVGVVVAEKVSLDGSGMLLYEPDEAEDSPRLVP